MDLQSDALPNPPLVPHRQHLNVSIFHANLCFLFVFFSRKHNLTFHAEILKAIFWRKKKYLLLADFAIRGQMTFIQRRFYVEATSLRCIDINATLYKRHVPAGYGLL